MHLIILLDDWTSFSDIGGKYSGKVLTKEEYLRIEKLYLKSIDLIATCNMVSSFLLTNVEIYKDIPPELIYCEGQTVNLETSLTLARSILREEQWCKFINPKMFVHFGYDYHMYIGSENAATNELEQIRKSGLYIENQVSPYE